MADHRYLLDTNILSDLIKQPAGTVARRIISLDNEELLCTSIIVACELRYGAYKKNSPALIRKVDQLLEAVAILPLEEQMINEYAKLRTILENGGTPIGSNDLLIAAQAKSLNLIMVTGNVREFSRVPDLRVENWLKGALKN